jgi:hypothetical protein
MRKSLFGLSEMLEECECDHREERVMMQAAPGATFKVVEAELFFHLLVGLLARPTCFERSDQGLKRRVVGIVGEVILGLSSRASLIDEPDLVAGAVAMSKDRVTIGDTDA